MDLSDIYQAAGGESEDRLVAFVERQELSRDLRERVRQELMQIGHSQDLCTALGMDYRNPQFTPVARAYAYYQAGCR
ncbi:hypothetical protein HYT52_00330 [Candidatus Woesearchaeota archaeon]|nr:hypothetical protein [Candidatus Woesearchaeota archaeon]